MIEKFLIIEIGQWSNFPINNKYSCKTIVVKLSKE